MEHKTSKDTGPQPSLGASCERETHKGQAIEAGREWVKKEEKRQRAVQRAENFQSFSKGLFFFVLGFVIAVYFLAANLALGTIAGQIFFARVNDGRFSEVARNEQLLGQGHVSQQQMIEHLGKEAADLRAVIAKKHHRRWFLLWLA